MNVCTFRQFLTFQLANTTVKHFPAMVPFFHSTTFNLQLVQATGKVTLSNSKYCNRASSTLWLDASDRTATSLFKAGSFGTEQVAQSFKSSRNNETFHEKLKLLFFNLCDCISATGVLTFDKLLFHVATGALFPISLPFLFLLFFLLLIQLVFRKCVVLESQTLDQLIQFHF